MGVIQLADRTTARPDLSGRCHVTDNALSGTPANPQVRVPGTDSLNWLLACPPMLLEFTFDQLRTLVVVQEAGSANSAARILGRDWPTLV